jgi:hypothetical protein
MYVICNDCIRTHENIRALGLGESEIEHAFKDPIRGNEKSTGGSAARAHADASFVARCLLGQKLSFS